jgi:hypothetical protein
MDYSADLCMTKFTAGQYKCMAQALRTYRPKLVAVTAVPFGRCDATATSLEQCTCSNSDEADPNGAYLPTSHCLVRGQLDPNVTNPWSGTIAPPLPATHYSTNGSGGTSGGLSDGALAAIVGCAAIVIIIFLIVMCYVCSRRKEVPVKPTPAGTRADDDDHDDYDSQVSDRGRLRSSPARPAGPLAGRAVSPQQMRAIPTSAPPNGTSAAAAVAAGLSRGSSSSLRRLRRSVR